jgi:hypothetical protein
MADPSLNSPRLYLTTILAGAGLGLLVWLGLLPEIPNQLESWLQSLDGWLALVVLLAGGAVIGAALTGLAQLGVHWQLRRGPAGPTD